MSDPRETLARIRAQADAATPGPWESIDLPVGVGGYTKTIHSSAGTGKRWTDLDPEIAATVSEADAEFIAAARTTVPALLSLLEKALELHRPVSEDAILWECAEGECDHEDDEHHLDTVTLCGECYRLAVEVSPYYGENGCSAVLWPCPTFKAITADNP